MARSFGRVLAAIWDDEDFCALSPTAQRMYLFLLSQGDLEHSGLIPLRPRRWAKACTSLTPDQVAMDLKELAGARFVVADEDTEELLVRSLIRRDEVWRQPNVFKAAAASACAALSGPIKAVLHTEIGRLDLSAAAEDSRRVRQALLADLEPFANPSGNPSPNPSPGEPVPTMGKGERNGSTETLPLAPIPDPQSTAGEPPPRDDVERLCEHLADRVAANGSKRPDITQRWRDAARLLMDRDRRTEKQIHAAIDWCQDSEFWRANIQSMPTLREKYDTIRLQAQRTPGGRASPAHEPYRNPKDQSAYDRGFADD